MELHITSLSSIISIFLLSHFGREADIAAFSSSAPVELQTYDANLDGLTTTRRRYPRCGLHQRLADVDYRATGWTTPRVNRTTRFETKGKAVSIAYQTKAGRQGRGSEKWPPERFARMPTLPTPRERRRHMLCLVFFGCCR